MACAITDRSRPLQAFSRHCEQSEATQSLTCCPWVASPSARNDGLSVDPLTAPAPIAPGCQGGRPNRPLGRDRIIARPAPGVAAADTGKAHPAAGPKAMGLDRLIGIFGAARHVAALSPDEGRQGQLIGPDGPMGETAGPERDGCHPALPVSIWSSAWTTASKVSRVEAWRAL